MAGDTKRASSGGEGMGFIAALLVLVFAGAGAGYSLSLLMPAAAPKSEASNSNASRKVREQEEAKASGANGAAQLSKPESGAAKEQLMALEPILVTLAGSKGNRLRIEVAAILAAGSKSDHGVLMREMTEDLMVFLRTITLAQVETATGLEYLREDMSELVQLRSRGLARGLVIKALIVE